MSRLFRQATTLVFLALSTLKLSALPHADRIIIHKKERTMELMRAGQVIKTYKIALGGQPVGPKMRQGDHRTPEGVYVIDRRNAQSQFHRSLHISYPSASDRERARKVGVSPGETFLSMACRVDTVSSGRHIAPAIGPMAVSL